MNSVTVSDSVAALGKLSNLALEHLYRNQETLDPLRAEVFRRNQVNLVREGEITEEEAPEELYRLLDMAEQEPGGQPDPVAALAKVESRDSLEAKREEAYLQIRMFLKVDPAQ